MTEPRNASVLAVRLAQQLLQPLSLVFRAAWPAPQPCHAAIAGRPQARSCCLLVLAGPAPGRTSGPLWLVWVSSAEPMAPGNIACQMASGGRWVAIAPFRVERVAEV